jgi:hypothetical protein
MGRLRAIVMASGVLLGILGLCGIVHGLATEQIGPDADHPTVAQPGWPKGIEEILRHPSRVYSVWCNGNENFYFKAAPGQINELLALFSKARLRDHEVRIETGKPSVKSFNNQVFEYNVSLPILDGIALFMTRGENNEDTLEPRLTICPGDDGVLLKQLKLPENVIVSDAVGNPGLQGKRAVPVRKAWYGRVQFEDSSPAADFEHGLSVHITFWEKDFKDGIRLAHVDREGFFKAVLSDQEIAGLEKGNPWLTMTVANWQTQAKKEDAKFPVQMLAREKEKAAPQKISRPKYYYGRILFEDGAPPVLDPKRWPGAEIFVLFDYAGSVKPDAEGYFQVFLGPEQVEKLKAEKTRKNIYYPTGEKGSSTARYAFPAELLSQDKAKAGVVKIQKPVYKAPEKDMTF